MQKDRLNWERLLNKRRFSSIDKGQAQEAGTEIDWLVKTRREIERDYDRILFSAPVRRLGDKTQVFPLEKNDSVRNRLTHSHEVSNLARSVGVHIAYGQLGKAIAGEIGSTSEAIEQVQRDIPAMLSAVGLAHDLGNPPFGHQGEAAIRSWMVRNAVRVFDGPNPKDYLDGSDFTARNEEVRPLNPKERDDFLKFEGNAQTLRVVARLQVVENDLGLNLTYGTLAALMKYTVGALETDKSGNASRKKIGHFTSDVSIVDGIRSNTGLKIGQRHPLTFIMEACDDVAYCVIDAEDAVKKQTASFSDLLGWLATRSANDQVMDYVIDRARADRENARKSGNLSAAEINDVSMQKFRVHAIHALMSQITAAFEQNYEGIMSGTFDKSLVDACGAKRLIEALREFDAEHAYRNRRVREIELQGFNVLNGLMDLLWRGITERSHFFKLEVARDDREPFSAFSYSCISENYRRIFDGRVACLRNGEAKLPIRYRELQLLTDMVSGMTDQYAVDLEKELRGYHVGASENRAR
jgi:dGTPase